MISRISNQIRSIFKVSAKKYSITEVREHVFNVVIHDGKQNCADITIYQDSNDIYVNHIDRCKFFRGTYIVTNIIQFAKELEVTKISLRDKSMIRLHECDISLPYYTILIHGMSWYNRFGFISRNYNKESQYNQHIPLMSLPMFTEALVDAGAVDALAVKHMRFDEFIHFLCLRTTTTTSPRLQEIIQQSTTISKLIRTLTAFVHDNPESELNMEICTFINCIAFLAKKYLIRYSPDLVYVISSQVKGGRRRPITRKRCTLRGLQK